MNAADQSWQALEIVLGPEADRPRYAMPIEQTLATIVYEALWTYDCGPITYLSIPGVDRHRTLLRAGSSPDPGPSTTCPSLPTVETTAITDATRTLTGCAVQRCTDRVGLSVVDVDTSPLGRSSAYTQRLLSSRSGSTPSFSTEPPALATLLAAVATGPHALAVVAERGPNDTTAISVRLVDFSPGAQVYSRETLARSCADPPVSLSEVVGGAETITNWELLEGNGWDLTTEDRFLDDERPVFRKVPHSSQTARRADLARQVADADREYIQVFARCPADPLADSYRRLDVTGQLPITSEQLPAFFPVATRQYPHSVWGAVDGRTALRIQPVVAVSVPDTMSILERDPTATASRTTPASVIGDYSAFERAAMRWCFEQGEGVFDTDSQVQSVPFERVTADDTRTLAYLVSDEAFQPGRLIGAVWDAYHEPTLAGVSVFAESRPRAKQAAQTLLRPFNKTTDDETILYRRPASLQTGAAIAVRSAETTPERWILTPTNELQCRIDGTVIAHGSVTDPLDSIADQLPQITHTDGTITLTHPQESKSQVYETADAARAATAPIRTPARPAHLATGLDSATVFYQDGANFKQFRLPSLWEGQLTTRREATALRTFVETYTIANRGATLSYETVIPEFVSYLYQRTDCRISPLLQPVLEAERRDHPDLLANRRWRYQPPSLPSQE